MSLTPDQIPEPKAKGLTPEAAEALGAKIPDLDGTDSDDTDFAASFEPPFESPFADMQTSDLSEGDIIDAEIVDEQPPPVEVAKLARQRRTRSTPPKSETKPPREAKSGPPNLDEWVGFFSKVVLKVATEFYITAAFRDIDEESLTEREVDRLIMTDDERQTIAVPFAELSNKSKFMRKHGRLIVSSGDAFNAVVVFGMWMSRVNRIAAKHRPRQPKIHQMRMNANGSSGPSQTTSSGEQTGSTGGRIPNGFAGPIFGSSGG